MKRVAKVITVFILCLSVIVCSSFSVFAYNPVISIPSAAWDVAADGTFKAVYPESAPPLTGLIDDVFKHSDYYGNTYFTSDYWDDDYEKLSSLDFYFPDFPDSNYNHHDYDNHIIVRIHDFYYLIQDFAYYVSFHSDYDSLYYYTGLEEIFYIYKLSYPFSEWQLSDTVYAFDTQQYIKIDLPEYEDEFEIVYSDVNILGYQQYSGIVYIPDNFYAQTKLNTIEFYAPMSVLTGTMSYALTGDMLKNLVKGDYIIKWSDQGFIIGTNTDYIFYNLSSSLYQKGDFLGTVSVIQRTVFDGDTDDDFSSLEPGYAYPPETDMTTINMDYDFPYEDVIITFSFVFVSTGYNLFFPGNLEFIRFDDFEEEQEHNEIVGTLNTISGSLTDLNNNMPSAIKKELEPIYADIKNDLSRIIDGDTGVPDVNIDTSDMDNAVEEQDRIISGIYDDVDNLTNDLLQKFGYSSMDEFFQDNMNDLNDTNMLASFDFVKMLFEKIVSATGISVLMLFSLTFAFAMYILGRRLS